MKTFKKDKYLIIKNAISKDMALLGFNYLVVKKQVLETLKNDRVISPYEEELFGTLGDSQIPIKETYCCYSDLLMETFLIKLLPLMCEKTKLDLVPMYSYTRLYTYGSTLKRHKDRSSCAVSTTLNLGGDKWPIYLSPNENVGIPEHEGGKRGIKIESKAQGTKVDLSPGDMLIYKGCEIEHWREPFTGEECGQVFLHYNEKSRTEKLFDGRPHVGYPINNKGGELPFWGD
jgi:hypothetical protein